MNIKTLYATAPQCGFNLFRAVWLALRPKADLKEALWLTSTCQGYF